ncbi:MAG TPA: hypothetical protein VEI29_07260, partial [Burkholderiaceae bacterium]|nr:hypothetical protein [Burkholderiaceae bacterium]
VETWPAKCMYARGELREKAQVELASKGLDRAHSVQHKALVKRPDRPAHHLDVALAESLQELFLK